MFVVADDGAVLPLSDLRGLVESPDRRRCSSVADVVVADDPANPTLGVYAVATAG